MVEPIRGAMEPRPLHPDQGSGEAGIETVTDEIDEAEPQDATADPGVQSAIAQLGVEARAEYIRARRWLGLGDEPAERLGTVGRYRLEAELGRGGMGIVFRASDPELDRPVAIKLVQAVPFARYDKLRTRLLREAKVLAKLTHPNVVRVYDCGQHEGEVYLAMELVEGATLRDWQRGQSRRSILDAYQQAARGLAAAHDLGITHRDFKPDNALVASDARVLVGDFGLAGVPAGDELRTEGSPTDPSPGQHVSATRTGALLGTPTYMAPEQLRGEVATPLSDQFAFCVSVWEALTGLRPFEGEQRDELLEQIERGRVRGAERLPRRLRGLLLRGLAVEPEARFDHLRDLAGSLVPRRGRVVIAAALSVSLAVGLVVGKWLPGEEPPPCELPNLLDDVTAMPEWERVREQLENTSRAPSYDRLLRLVEGMRNEANALCRPASDEQIVRQERLEMRLGYLRGILESPVIEDPAQLLKEIDFLERWTAPPPRPVDDEVERRLQESDSLRLHNQLEDALQAIDEAVAVAGDRDLELALAYRWRGRVLAPLGRYEEAMDAYREAAGRADAASYDDARLESELLTAEIAVMRLGDLARARDSLDRSRRLLRRLREPWLSLRWASYHEVLAAILKREGQLDDALVHQEYAILVRGWWGDEIEVAMGYLNLGTIHEQRDRGSDSELARLNYERSFEILRDWPSSPEWSEAAFNLGHWLVQYGGSDEWRYARDLLWEVRTKSEDMRLSALTELLLLEILREDFGEARSLARALENSLASDSSLSAERCLDAWQAIATAHAQTPELAAFESARSSFEGAAQALLADATPVQALAVRRQTAELDLTAALGLQAAAPARALALATSARDLLLQLPDKMRTPGMLEATKKLLLDLRSSTASIEHP